MPSTPRSRPRPVFRSARVSEIQDLSPRLRRVRFTGEELLGLAWTAGQKVKIKGPDFFRSYTPSAFDAQEGWMDVIIFLHGSGPASQWAAQAKAGDLVEFTGPSKSMDGPEGIPDWALFLGDESTIGLAVALIRALPDGVNVLGAIQLDAVDAGAVLASGLSLVEVTRSGEHGDALIGWLQQTVLPDGHGMIWVSGEAISARALKQALMERAPEKVQFKMKAYWSRKGHAHRKAMGI